MEHWLCGRRRKIAQDKMSVFGWDDALFYWIYVYLSGLMRYHL